MKHAVCPECDTPITFPKNFKIGLVVECPACAAESEIISVKPLILSPLEEEK